MPVVRRFARLDAIFLIAVLEVNFFRLPGWAGADDLESSFCKALYAPNKSSPDFAGVKRRFIRSKD